MKIGLILECGREGPDQQVYSHVIRIVAPKVEVTYETLLRKNLLIQECGKVARALLDDGCDKVGIVWDLYPKWRKPRETHCRGQDRDEIQASLQAAGVTFSRVHLVCVEEELEAWLISDERALTEFLSKLPAHPARKVPKFKRPESVSNPKGVLRGLMEQYGKGRYNEMQHAAQIIRKCPDWTRLESCPSFVRFLERILGKTPAGK